MTAPLPSTIPADVGQRLDALPNGLGDFIEQLIQARKSQAQISAALAEVDPSLVPVVDESAANVAAGRDDIDNTTNQYVNRDDALAPVENTPMGAVASLQNKADALAGGTDAVRAQMPPADMRRVLVEALAQKYYQQAKAAASGMGGAMGGGQGGGMGGGQGGGAPGGGGGGNPLSALSGLSSTPASLVSGLAGKNGKGEPGTLLAARATPEGALPPEIGSEKGLQRNTILIARAISAAFPEIKEIGGVRADSLKWHPNGLAIDVMIPNYGSAEGKALGDRVLAFAMKHAAKYGLDHAIWRQTMYTQGSAPRLMATRAGGDLTQNHFDHVHIATSRGGYPTGGETYSL
ncbi:hypothetical protein [Mycolicibacterium fortuitum]|uniref:ARB-07466-like C-terminal domain-containing protein n=2 Tax=Mycolicibacterium fortuitum TaxID=1766 RepID=A0AAE4VKM9_MYCFO|nr:hypothetical protein [Mycolicibacterium fortuitum]MCV7144252.1 hypothetical protein [Mycolicibacterium fortuitum]MDV7195358.1 hypothetical protein [Mycolicibacterium fortuitum]MDV7209057.1 hypothetical protein [Mycolicibacterium fortuitum]MDV7230901.1 hypothetical protein [Mycolicibacterium fortuitum]MDV7262472.1 hypothetical protein [Mycolicibacterium fortuitum]